MPSYQVTLTAYQTVVVHDVENEQAAMDLAWEEHNSSNFQIDEASVDCELKSVEEIEHAENYFNVI